MTGVRLPQGVRAAAGLARAGHIPPARRAADRNRSTKVQRVCES